MGDAKRILQNRIHEVEQKINHVLLTASGAAIGFTFTQVKEIAPTVENAAVVIAVVLWALSFAYGIKCHHVLIGYLRQNILLVDELSAVPPVLHSRLREKVDPIMQTELDKLQFSERLQLYLFFAGAISLFVWYLIKGLGIPCLAQSIF